MANKKEELVKRDTSEEIAELPDSIPVDESGSNMRPEDMKIPRLLFAQGPSTQIIEGDPTFIEGLKMFDLFNDLTGEIYGKGPLTFIPIRHDIRYIEFRPRSEGGGVIDLNVPPNDPRTKNWRNDPQTGKRLPPSATKFNEYIVLIVSEAGLEPVMFSIKDTNKWNRAAAARLNSFIEMPTKVKRGGVTKLERLPMFGKVYELKSGQGKNDNGVFAVPVIDQKAVIVDLALREAAKKYHEEFKTKNLDDVTREPGDDTEFDTGAMEAEGAAAVAQEM